MTSVGAKYLSAEEMGTKEVGEHIGNIDLVFSGGTLKRRTETEAATATGGLDVRGVTWTIEHNKTLLDNISGLFQLSVSPQQFADNMNAVIGK